MEKIKSKRKTYVRPAIAVVKFTADKQILAGSPPVNPIVGIESPTEDNEDTELSGTKDFTIWSAWDE